MGRPPPGEVTMHDGGMDPATAPDDQNRVPAAQSSTRGYSRPLPEEPPPSEPGPLSRLAASLRSGLKSALARRFVTMIFAFSSVLAFLISPIQVAMEYRGNIEQLESTVLSAQRSLAPSLTEGLWLLDRELIKSNLDGLLQIEGVIEAIVLTDEGEEIRSDRSATPPDRSFTFDILRDGSETQTKLGTLILHVSHALVKQRSYRLAALTLLSNLFQALLVAGFILTIYQFFIGRHLYELARYASDYDLDAVPAPVRLDRNSVQRGALDELSMLETALSDWARANYAHTCKLRSNSKEQSEFNYAISHDLKSPTNTVVMLLEEMRELGGEDLDEDLIEVLDDLDRTVERMSKLIEDVMEYSRTIGEDIITEEVDLSQEVADILRDLSSDVARAEAEVRLGPLPVIQANAVQIRMLLQNLIANALKFRDPDRKAEIDITMAPAEDGWLSIAVRDNGIGIPDEHFDKIFGMFQRLHTKDSFEGTGIGLTTCQRVAANHQGRIEVASELGQGTTFIVYLPDEKPKLSWML